MAKKKKETIEESIVEETVVMEQPKVKPETRREKKNPVSDDGWEIKDRLYILNGVDKPLSKSIRACNIYWFDEKKGYERELKNTSNQRTCFVDEMKGDQRLEHIIFRNGQLSVPKSKTVLQKLLSLYHPNREKLYHEHKPQVDAASEIDNIELELEALNAAKDLDIDMAEAVMRVEIGSRVSDMSSKELRRDLLLYAKRNPILFLELVNDENVQLRNC